MESAKKEYRGKKLNNVLKIYLAGAMSGLSYHEMNYWRILAQNYLEEPSDMKGYKIQIINPVEFYNFENKSHKTEKEVMSYDLWHVKTSDIVLVNIDKLNTSVGTCVELYQCYIQGTPVIAFGDSAQYELLHPWIKEMIHRYEKYLYKAIEYISDYYMI